MPLVVIKVRVVRFHEFFSMMQSIASQGETGGVAPIGGLLKNYLLKKTNKNNIKNNYMEKQFLKRKEFFMEINHEVIQGHLNIRDNIYWMDSKGSSHNLPLMDINYIRNCVNKMERGDADTNVTKEMLPWLKRELIYREILKNEARRNSI